jgi:hypothetical protein
VALLTRTEGTVNGALARRTVRRIEPWSVFKFSLLFSVTLALVFLLAGAILYFIASTAGAVEGLQSFIQNAGWPHFRVRPDRVFEVLGLMTLASVVGWMVVLMLTTFVFNLVAEAVGGIDVTVRE